MLSIARVLPYLMLVAVTLIWSTNFVAGRALSALPPFFLAASRFSVAGAIFLLLLFLKGFKLPAGRVRWLILLMGVCGIFIFNPLVYLGLHYTTSINATLINAFSPLTTALLSFLWLKEEMTRYKAAGLLLSIIGVGWIAIQGTISNLLHLSFNRGDLLVFLASCIWAVYNVLTKLVSGSLKPLQSTVFATLSGLLFLIPAALIETARTPIPAISPATVSLLVYLGIFPSVIGFLLWNSAVSKVGPTQASIFYNLIPVFNALLAVNLLHEKFSAYHLVGSVCIISGVIISSTKAKALRREELRPVS